MCALWKSQRRLKRQYLNLVPQTDFCVYTFVCGRVPWLYQYWPGGFMVLWFYVQELLKAQPAVVLVLKRLRRRGISLKSHRTDWEKPGIEPATPGLQDIGLSPTPRRLLVRNALADEGFAIYSLRHDIDK